MSANKVIANYESLAVLTGQMIETARKGEWTALVTLEQQRTALVSAMKLLDATTPLDESARQRKKDLINSVLAQDAEIRKLVQAWMGEHELSMQSNAQELRLLREYGA